MKRQRCFICYNYSLEVKCNDESGAKINDQLSVIFVLRKFLQIPLTICLKFLEEHGNPSSWISWCSSCSNLIKKAQDIFDTMISLEKQMENLRKGVKEEILQSFDRFKLPANPYSEILMQNIPTNVVRSHTINGDDDGTKNHSNLRTDIHNLLKLDVKTEPEEFDSEFYTAGNYETDYSFVEKSYNSAEIQPDLTGASHFEDVKVNMRNTRKSALIIRTSARLSEDDFETNYNEDDENTNINQPFDSDEDYEPPKDKKIEMCKRTPEIFRKTQSPKNHGTFICSKCPKKFAHHWYLKKHYKTEHNVIWYGCSICQEILSSQSELDSHESVHTDVLRQHCKICSKVFTNRSKLQDHCRKTHPKEYSSMTGFKRRNSPGVTLHTCSVCGYSCSAKSNLKKHVCNPVCQEPLSSQSEAGHKDSSKQEHVCKICSKVFANRSKLQDHCRKTHPKEYSSMTGFKRRNSPGVTLHTCSVCGYSCIGKSNLKKHVCQEPLSSQSEAGHKDSSKQEQVCKICSKVFANRSKLQDHCRKSHPREYSSMTGFKRRSRGGVSHLTCSVCNYACNGMATLEKHMCKHTGEKSILCELCSNTFRTTTHLKYHRHNTHWEELGLEPYKCKICNTFYVNPNYLQIHIKKAHEKKFKFLCSICSQGFMSACYLKVHMKYHKGERTVKCPECDVQFFTNARLKVHMRNHTGDRPFPCKLCDKAFTHKTAYKRHHVSVHTGKKEFKCHLCDSSFALKSNLRIHLKSHVRKGEIAREEVECNRKLLRDYTIPKVDTDPLQITDPLTISEDKSQ